MLATCEEMTRKVPGKRERFPGTQERFLQAMRFKVTREVTWKSCPGKGFLENVAMAWLPWKGFPWLEWHPDGKKSGKGFG